MPRTCSVSDIRWSPDWPRGRCSLCCLCSRILHFWLGQIESYRIPQFVSMKSSILRVLYIVLYTSVISSPMISFISSFLSMYFYQELDPANYVWRDPSGSVLFGIAVGSLTSLAYFALWTRIPRERYNIRSSTLDRIVYLSVMPFTFLSAAVLPVIFVWGGFPPLEETIICLLAFCAHVIGHAAVGSHLRGLQFLPSDDDCLHKIQALLD